MLDAANDLVEQLDELCGGLVAQARQIEGQDDVWRFMGCGR